MLGKITIVLSISLLFFLTACQGHHQTAITTPASISQKLVSKQQPLEDFWGPLANHDHLFRIPDWAKDDDSSSEQGPLPRIVQAEAVYETQTLESCLRGFSEEVCYEKIRRAAGVSSWPPPTTFPVVKMLLTLDNSSSNTRDIEVKCWVGNDEHLMSSRQLTMLPSAKQQVELFLDHPAKYTKHAQCQVQDSESEFHDKALVVNL